MLAVVPFAVWQYVEQGFRQLYAQQDLSVHLHHNWKHLCAPSLLDRDSSLLTHRCVLQLTYDSFRNKATATGLLATPRPGESGFTETVKKDSMDELINLLQPKSAARSYQVKQISITQPLSCGSQVYPIAC